MPTPTISHIDPPASPCGCWRNDVCGYLCTHHAAKLQKQAANEGLQQWAESYGAAEVRAERMRPALRVVR